MYLISLLFVLEYVVMAVRCCWINFRVTVPYVKEFISLVLIACTFFFCASLIHSATTPWRRQPPSWVSVQRTCTLSKQMKGKKAKTMTVISEPFKNAVVLFITNLFECNWKSFKSVSLRGKMIPEELEKQVQRARKEVRGGEREREGERSVCRLCACVWVKGRATKSEQNLKNRAVNVTMPFLQVQSVCHKLVEQAKAYGFYTLKREENSAGCLLLMKVLSTMLLWSI